MVVLALVVNRYGFIKYSSVLERNTDFYLKVESHAKEIKERSMNEQFRKRFEEGLQKIADSISKKGGVKLEDKVHERIGRLKQKYPSIHRYFEIEVDINAQSGIYFLRTSLQAKSEQFYSITLHNLSLSIIGFM